MAQLAVIAATLPQLPECFRDLCFAGHPGLVQVLDLRRPFIDNVEGGGTAPGMETHCPGPGASGTTFRLDRAPLPEAFRPSGGAAPLLACVRVGSDGSIGAVRLVSGTGRASLDRKLIETIRRQWRFEPLGPRVRPGWQRVRFNH